jgi:glutathione S-transferase
MTIKLIIGNKNYSSWSFRPWLGLRATGIMFHEEVIPLYVDAASKAQIVAYSPAGKVPILIDGQGDSQVKVWESLAILEYAAEKFRDARLWPSESKARAHARAISTEMHAGFVPLRSECGMNMWRPPAKKDLSKDAHANIARIQTIWTETRAKFGEGGPFLFGKFTAADAMYAPVVTRFDTYGGTLAPVTRAYVDAVLATPAMRHWYAEAAKETWPEPGPDE